MNLPDNPFDRERAPDSPQGAENDPFAARLAAWRPAPTRDDPAVTFYRAGFAAAQADHARGKRRSPVWLSIVASWIAALVLLTPASYWIGRHHAASVYGPVVAGYQPEQASGTPVEPDENGSAEEEQTGEQPAGSAASEPSVVAEADRVPRGRGLPTDTAPSASTFEEQPRTLAGRFREHLTQWLLPAQHDEYSAYVNPRQPSAVWPQPLTPAHRHQWRLADALDASDVNLQELPLVSVRNDPVRHTVAEASAAGMDLNRIDPPNVQAYRRVQDNLIEQLLH